jgi:hypothetical protein
VTVDTAWLRQLVAKSHTAPTQRICLAASTVGEIADEIDKGRALAAEMLAHLERTGEVVVAR